MRPATAFLDASALYPAPLRDLLLELAVSDLYRARWSETVLDEWVAALLRNRPDLARNRLERTRNLMNASTRDALVTGYEGLIGTLALPDPGDRHVLAAAIAGEADIVVTANLKDFPADTLQPWGIKAQHPDIFMTDLFRRDEGDFLAAVRTVRLRLRNPPKSPEEYLDILRTQGLAGTVRAIAPFSRSI